MINAEALVADGWQPLKTVRYSAALGPTFLRDNGGVVEVALLAQAHLGNDSYGIVHGGAMMTFADMALGCGVGRLAGASHFVTAQMQVQFVAAAQTGTLITCRPEMVRKTSSMVFMRGLIESGGQTVASADGIFKVLHPEKAGRIKAG